MAFYLILEGRVYIKFQHALSDLLGLDIFMYMYFVLFGVTVII